MTNRIEIKTHHIDFYKDVNNRGSDLLDNVDPHYLVGTEEEIKKFENAHKEVINAISTGHYLEISKKPDVICQACPNIQCPYSMAVADKSDFRWTRFRVKQQIALELKAEGFDMDSDEGLRSANLFTKKRAAELFKQRMQS